MTEASIPSPKDSTPSSFPMAPSEEEWAQLSPDQRAKVVERLPAAATEAEVRPPEGDPHLEAKLDVRDALMRFYRGSGRGAYIGCEMTVYYPGEPRFVPDLFVALDVDPHSRMKWVVSAEGRGLDVVIEVHVAGDHRKDLERNVERYARLGIPEYFIYDRGRQRISGFTLTPSSQKAYMPIVPQVGRYASRVLGLDLILEDGRLRFYSANAVLLSSPDLVLRLENAVNELERSREIDQRAREEEQRALEAEQRAREAEQRAREAAETKLQEVQAELDRLRKLLA